MHTMPGGKRLKSQKVFIEYLQNFILAVSQVVN